MEELEEILVTMLLQYQLRSDRDHQASSAPTESK